MRAARGQKQDEVPLVSGQRLSGVGRCCARCSARSAGCKIGGGNAASDAAVVVIAAALAVDSDSPDMDMVPSQPALARSSSAVPRAEHIPFDPLITPPLVAHVSPVASSVAGAESDVDDIAMSPHASPQPVIRIHSRSPSPVTANKRPRNVKYTCEVMEERLSRLRAEHLVLDMQIQHLEEELSVFNSVAD